MKFEINKSSFKSRDFIILVVYLLAVIFNAARILPGSILLVITIVANINYIYKFRNSQAIMICATFALTYWLYMLLYYFGGINYCTYSLFRTPEYTDGTLRIAGLFMNFLFYFIKTPKDSFAKYIPKRNNMIVWTGCSLVMLLIIAYTYRVGGNFSYKSEGVNSSLYEYYFIFALFAFVYAGDSIKEKILLVINAIYILALLRLGLRLVVLMIVLMLFIEYFENRFKTRYILLALVGGFLFMSFWSMLRSGLVGEKMDLLSMLGVTDRALVTNQGDVFYTSSAQYAQVALGKWTISDRLVAFGSFFGNIVLTNKHQLPAGKLNVLMEQMGIKVPGGGFGGMYAFVWLDVVGVVLLAYYISHFINNITNEEKNGLTNIYGVFLVFTFFRWYAYNLAIVFKMGFWLLIVYYVIYLFDKAVRRE